MTGQRLATLLAAFTLLSITAVNAQEAPIRQGFWFSLGAGLGSHGVSCDNCIGAVRETGFATSFRVGGTLSPQVTLGADLSGWVKPLNDPGRGEYAFMGALMGEVQLYLKPESGLFILAGGGYVIDVVDDDLVLDTPGIVLGGGYDIRAGRGFSITPYMKYFRTIDGGNLTSSLYQFGLAATWH
jgi:hypothetical protein